MCKINRIGLGMRSLLLGLVFLLLLYTLRAQDNLSTQQEMEEQRPIETSVSVDGRVLQEASENPGGYVDHTASGKLLTNGEYPSTTLSCYSSYTKPDGQSICPEARSKYCVKELSTLKQDLCGQSQYFGDQYLENLCVLRKCAATCEEGQYPFKYAGLDYVRVRYCCQSNYCNGSLRSMQMSVVTLTGSIGLVCLTLLYYL